MLLSTISPESLPDKFNEFFVHKIEEIRSSFDPDRSVPTNPVEFSGTAFAEFHTCNWRLCKTRSPGNAPSLVTLTPYPPLSFMIVWMNLFP